MNKKVVITAGGTCGHIIPAEMLMKELMALGVDVHFVTHEKKAKTFNQVEGSSFIHAATLRKNPLSWPRSFWDITKGTVESLGILHKFEIDLVIGFGSFHTLPMLTAAWLLSVPIVLHEANSVPGRVNRFFSGQAAWTGLFFSDTEKKLKGKTKQVNLPLRKEFLEGVEKYKKEALEMYGFDPEKKTVLVFGGSQGALAINTLVLSTIPLLSKKLPIQVLHFTGCMDEMLRVKEVYTEHKIPHVVKDFEKKMHYAWACADCVISRSGASTIAEQIASEVPAIFIPYPYAKDDHQLYNARYVEKTLGGAKVIEQKTATPMELLSYIEKFLDPEVHQAIQMNLRKEHNQLQRSTFCEEVMNYLQKGSS